MLSLPERGCTCGVSKGSLSGVPVERGFGNGETAVSEFRHGSNVGQAAFRVVNLRIEGWALFFSNKAFRSDKVNSAGSFTAVRGESNCAARFKTDTAGSLCDVSETQ